MKAKHTQSSWVELILKNRLQSRSQQLRKDVATSFIKDRNLLRTHDFLIAYYFKAIQNNEYIICLKVELFAIEYTHAANTLVC